MIRYLILSAVLIGVVFFGFFPPIENRTSKERRQELYMLDTILGRLDVHLSDGGQVPTNWLTLSNAYGTSEDWEVLNKIGKPRELYTVLPRPVLYSQRTGGYVFLVRSRPRTIWWDPGSAGRWVLIGFSSTNVPGGPWKGLDRRVFRGFIPERELSDEIRAQIKEADQSPLRN